MYTEVGRLSRLMARKIEEVEAETTKVEVNVLRKVKTNIDDVEQNVKCQLDFLERRRK